MARTSELLGDFYNHAPAPALVMEANRAVQSGTAPAIQAIRTQLCTADVTHHDESGLRIAGTNQWLHVSSTDTLTHYGVHGKRGREAMAEIDILPNRQGVVVHDHWKSYQSFDQCTHAYCNAHHLRELHFIHEQYEQPWAKQMSQLLLDIKAEVEAQDARTNSLPPERQRFFEDRYDQLVHQGLAMNPAPDKPPTQRGRVKQSPPKNLLDRLHTHKPEVLAFMYDFRIPFDNNQAERDVRMIKLKQKISGAFRTQEGADTFCHIRSYISTVRKQGANVIDALSHALLHHPFIPGTSTEVPE
jgi:transposase